MAQENNPPHIPEQISWTSNPQKKYRGVIEVQNQQQQQLQHDRSLYKGSGFVKSSTQQSGGKFEGDFNDLGAIEINFGGSGFDVKSSYPQIQPIGQNKNKESEPILEITTDDAEPITAKKLESNDDAPIYDGFQPNYAHYSNNNNPIQMKKCVNDILMSLEQDGLIDYYPISKYTYVGRSFGVGDDCEFRLSIFSDDNYESVVEIRRSAGECFTYSNCEAKILNNLLKKGVINDKQNNNNEMKENDDDDAYDDDENESISSYGFGFGFGFDSLPSLESMELSSYSDEDDNNNIQNTKNKKKLNKKTAENILNDAVDQDLMRDVWRSNIAYLNDSLSRNQEIFKEIPKIIEIILGAITDHVFDCWAIKTYLGIISALISCNSKVPKQLYESIDHIDMRWSHMVINQVAPGVEFSFAPSQQIVRCCRQIKEQLKK